MNVSHFRKRLIGAVKNGMVWGVAWFGLAFVMILVLRTIGVVVPASISLIDAIGMSIKFGVMGGITGAAFSVFISLLYRGRRLAEISRVRFAIGGGVVAGLFVPAFMMAGNLISGDGFPPFAAIRGDILAAALFGGIAAGASMWLAQRRQADAGRGRVDLGRPADGNLLPPGQAQDATLHDRSGSRVQR
jgi:hypothetical protein